VARGIVRADHIEVLGKASNDAAAKSNNHSAAIKQRQHFILSLGQH